MKTHLRITIAAIATMFCTLNISAQDDLECSGEIDLVSKYIWRGTEQADISIQPEAEIAWKDLYFGVNANKSFSILDNEEVDLSLGYRAPFGMNIGICDYWQTGVDANNLFFEYGKDKTAHQLEGNIGYSHKRFSIQAYCIFYGNDYKLNGKQAYSTYVELAVPFKLAGLNWTATAGMTPMESAGSKTVTNYGYHIDYFYADGPACVLASLRACKELDLSKDVKLPIFVELISNPYLQKLHFVGGIGVKIGK